MVGNAFTIVVSRIPSSAINNSICMNLFSKLTLTGIELNHIDLLSDSEYFWLVTNESFQYKTSFALDETLREALNFCYDLIMLHHNYLYIITTEK